MISTERGNTQKLILVILLIAFGIIITTYMFGLFKKKEFKNISDYPTTWSVAQSTRDGKPLFIRFRSGLEGAIGHPKYPFQIGVAVPLLDPTPDGLTKNTEAEQLSDLEDKIIGILEKDNEAVEAVVITHNNMREFVFYASEWKPEYYEQKVKSIDSKPHELQFMMQHDPAWDTFKTYSVPLKDTSATSQQPFTPFASSDEKQYFENLVKTYLSAHGAGTVTFDGLFIATTGNGGQRYGFMNLAQICIQSDKKDWEAIIADHFSKLLSAKTETSALASTTQDYSKISGKLRLQLYPTSYLDEVPFKDELVYKSEIPGTISLLMLDLPSSIQTLKKSDIKPWGKTEEELLSVAKKNTLQSLHISPAKQTVGEIQLITLVNDDILTAVQVLDIAKYKECSGTHGTLIGIPTRNTIICFPIEDLTSVKAIQAMGAIIYGVNNEGPGSLSPLLYWYKDGVFESEPYEIKDKQFNFTPTDKFINELNQLK